MSRLIHDENDEQKETGAEGAPLLLPLSNSAVVAHLKACQSLAAEHSQKAFRDYLKALDDALVAEMDNAKSNQESAELAEVQSAFRQNYQELERYFCGYLSEGFVKFKKRELQTNVGSEAGDELSLVDNEDLEETIAISSITQRADSYFAEPLWALNQRFAVLNGGEHVTEASNPASPIQFCESLRKALKLVPLDPKSKQLAYKVYDDELIKILKNITEEVNQYLKQVGVLPHLKYSMPTGKAPASALNSESEQTVANEEDIQGLPDPNLSPEEYQQSLMQAIRGLQSQMVPSAVEGLPPGGVVVSSEDLMGALQALQTSETRAELGEQGAVVPIDVSEIVERLHEQLKADAQDGEVDKSDMQTIDLVGMLFEYMLNDENLPDSIKALLSYLHTPFLKIAFIDPGFFEQAEHPARVLLNNLAEAGARWVSNDGTAQYDMYNKIKDIVDRILKEFDNDVKIITELLLEFSSYTKNIVRRQELMEKRATEKAQGEEKLREVKLRVNEEIQGRTHGKELPSAILLFLLQPWSDYLSFALLRYGEKSDKWGKALAIVDDVLWCVEPKESPADKNRQLEIHDDLIAAIESGFETIGYDQAKGKKLVDALSSLIKLAMQSKKAEPAPPPMRDKLERIAAEKAGTKDASNDRLSPEEEQMVESLKMIEFGTWFEFEGGKRLKVAWYNSRTSHYMLVDQMGKRVDMMSGLKLARQMIGTKAKIISGSSKPFFERALENIFHKLNEKAELNKPGGENEAS
ncbi:HrpA-like helicases [Alteromonadaceae bacterium Bs31]|nr:HrpA-like helicases [Alteromonadaceae bacterium Bs31]